MFLRTPGYLVPVIAARVRKAEIQEIDMYEPPRHLWTSTEINTRIELQLRSRFHWIYPEVF